MAKVELAVDKRIIEQLGYSGEDGLILLLRVHLIRALKQEIESRNWTQNEAALFLGLKQPRISEIMQLRIDQFSVEKLTKLLYRLGKTVHLSIDL
ncbi:MAG TPA: XRE family transcriptional regulator [Candidatus Obscuribacter sp.]|nr:XRE family transcriptional regulator [Candidatus Obscuribacter sp.]HMY03024.1 XRE family transcriptional regulator [Candidatus Obscuribacter sp.]HMY53505.1 XRE family transcriptional regulator [Candidatus Obscuribacter sp.]HNB18608.1 XRE family transcriptional regulator [Candidatus Obscuribacter sp.]HND69716.1 XRE family transcriptional regulator [Candidatus Obscuribacter sp.]